MRRRRRTAVLRRREPGTDNTPPILNRSEYFDSLTGGLGIPLFYLSTYQRINVSPDPDSQYPISQNPVAQFPNQRINESTAVQESHENYQERSRAEGGHALAYPG
jgi:hypothetical protein